MRKIFLFGKKTLDLGQLLLYVIFMKGSHKNSTDFSRAVDPKVLRGIVFSYLLTNIAEEQKLIEEINQGQLSPLFAPDFNLRRQRQAKLIVRFYSVSRATAYRLLEEFEQTFTPQTRAYDIYPNDDLETIRSSDNFFGATEFKQNCLFNQGDNDCEFPSAVRYGPQYTKTLTNESIHIASTKQNSIITKKSTSNHRSNNVQTNVVRKPGRPRIISEEQMKVACEIFSTKRPSDFGYNYNTWQLTPCQLLLESICKLKLSKPTVSNYLNRYGYSSKSLTVHNIKRDPEGAIAWENKNTRIETRAKRINGIVVHVDESGLDTANNRPRGYAKKGRDGEGSQYSDNVKRLTCSVIIAISSTGALRYSVYDKSMNAVVFVNFLRRLFKTNPGRKIFLIADNLRVHHAIKTQEFVAKHRKEIQIDFLPAYYPELNAVEMINNHIKTLFRQQVPPANQAELIAWVRQLMKQFQNNPELVKSYFERPKKIIAALCENPSV
jgi:transposase